MTRWDVLIVQDQAAWEREHDLRLAQRDRQDDHTPHNAVGGSRTEHPQAAPTTQPSNHERKDRSWPYPKL